MLKSYCFKPKLLPSLAVLLLFPILLSLGFWQLGRMAEKEAMIGALAQGEMAGPVEFKGQDLPDYSKAKVRGKFLPEFSVLLEHQMHNSEPGYHLLTPLEISADLPWLWVNRGWVALDNIPSLQEPLKPLLDLTGFIYRPSENRFILGENFSKTLQGQIKIQRMDFAGLKQQFHHEIYPYVLLLDPSAPAGFVRDWQIKTLPPSKHLGYAVQWFALAGTLMCLYIIVNLKRK